MKEEKESLNQLHILFDEKGNRSSSLLMSKELTVILYNNFMSTVHDHVRTCPT